MDKNHPLYSVLKNYNLILASQSPRRKHLLQGMDIPFEVIVKQGIEENYPDSLSKTEIPVHLARLKADAYADLLRDRKNLTLTSDTIVWLKDKVIGKPESHSDAIEILKELSGEMHEVITGVVLSNMHKTIDFYTITKVWIREISENEINYYLEKYKPYDKAGAYGIQEWIGYVAVERIEGSFHNVMGLPVQALFGYLLDF